MRKDGYLLIFLTGDKIRMAPMRVSNSINKMHIRTIKGSFDKDEMTFHNTAATNV